MKRHCMKRSPPIRRSADIMISKNAIDYARNRFQKGDRVKAQVVLRGSLGEIYKICEGVIAEKTEHFAVVRFKSGIRQSYTYFDVYKGKVEGGKED